MSEQQDKQERINVRVLFFGAARETAGKGEVSLSLRGPTDAADALEQVLSAFPDLRRFGRSLLLAVNQEYAAVDREIIDGDELAVFPPVSGGAGKDTGTRGHGDTGTEIGQVSRADLNREVDQSHLSRFPYDFFELTNEEIDVGLIARRVVLPECGATVTLDGYAREWTRGRKTLYLVYETYAPMALSEMCGLGKQAHEQFEIVHIGMVHRTGRLEIGDTSVVICVSASHRRAAFAACEWAIRELKRTVPIWKKEVFANGEVWVEGE